MGRVFISYRRQNAWTAGRIFDRLVWHFGRTSSIEGGADFPKVLDEQVAQCSAFIALIGPDWAHIRSPEGVRRLDSPKDFVRLEIEGALKRKHRIIPVLIDGAQMPKPDDLPRSIKAFTRRNAMEV